MTGAYMPSFSHSNSWRVNASKGVGMSERPIAFIDLDGVLYDFVGGVKRGYKGASVSDGGDVQ